MILFFSMSDNGFTTEIKSSPDVVVTVPVVINKSKNDYKQGCLGVSICCSVFVLIVGAIMLMVYSIIGLVNYWDVGVECGVTQFVLTSLILSYTFSASLKADDVMENMCALLCRALIFAEIGIWGFVEIITSIDCTVYDTTLWWAGLFLAISDVLLLIMIIAFIVFSYCSSSSSS